MPVKITTDQAQAKRLTRQIALTTAYQAVLEPPYFSVPSTGDDSAVVDPSNADRELRPGEVFIASSIQIANISNSTTSVSVQLENEAGVTTMLSPELIIPPKDVRLLPPGISLFKRNLGTPAADGDILRALASADGRLQLTVTYIEREAIEHAPDTEA